MNTHIALDRITAHVRTETPVGCLLLAATDRGLHASVWEHNNPEFAASLEARRPAPNNAILVEAQRQLDEYFAGKRHVFQIPLDAHGTSFQHRVWDALVAIPYGHTRTYGEIAAEIGNPLSVRAVGAANGANPLPIIVPCHRVIGRSGKLTGFGGGLPNKAFLLDLEATRLPLVLSR